MRHNLNPGDRTFFLQTSLFRAILIQVPVFVVVFLLSILFTSRLVEDSLYSSLSMKASLALANLRTATSMLMKDGNTVDLQRLIENAGASRMVKRIRLISATERKVIASTDPLEQGQFIASPLIDTVISKHSLLEMTGKSAFGEGYEAVVPVSGSMFNTVSGADTIAVLQYVADMDAEKAFEGNIFLTITVQNGLLLLLVIMSIFVAWAIYVSKPLGIFRRVTELVALGDFSAKIVLERHDEFAVFAHAFNRMIEEIGLKNEELFRYSETLESRVAERTELLYRKTQELEATRQKVIDAERTALAGRIAGGVAHEINNPSGFIMSNLETLTNYIGFFDRMCRSAERNHNMPEKDLSELNWIMEDAPILIRESLDGMRRIVKIVRNLEISAYPDKGGFMEADIADLLDRAVGATCTAMERNGRLVKKWESGLVSQCIPTLCESALANILQNAVDYVADSGRIEVSAEKESHAVVIRIIDTGPGIPHEIIPHLFEPFFTTKAPGKGIGLGLTISKAIIEKAGGSIRVESDPGRTIFSVELPIDRTVC